MVPWVIAASGVCIRPNSEARSSTHRRTHCWDYCLCGVILACILKLCCMVSSQVTVACASVPMTARWHCTFTPVIWICSQPNCSQDFWRSFSEPLSSAALCRTRPNNCRLYSPLHYPLALHSLTPHHPTTSHKF